ncbi:hypothetical protein BASA83_012133 [Batrachochytrium salamandrivorans]|nr:hypothetical protein BASA83_012133 [Batrachochytrium salamandrivorans]
MKRSARTPQSNAIELSVSMAFVPFSSWGTAPPKVTKLWNSSKCSSQLCYIWKIKYDVVPFGSYGSLPDNFKKIWDHPNVQCKSRVYVKQ